VYLLVRTKAVGVGLKFRLMCPGTLTRLGWISLKLWVYLLVRTKVVAVGWLRQCVRMSSKAIHLRIRLPHTAVFDFEFDGVLSLSSLLSLALFVLVTAFFI
jgi:hypothetical protein